MDTLSVLTTIWGFVFATFVALMIYRAQLTQHEHNTLYLESYTARARQSNETMVRRAQRVLPLCKAFCGAVALSSLVVVGTFVTQEILARL